MAAGKAGYGLTAHEVDIVEYVARGLTNRQIACARGTSHHTIRNQLATIFKKVEVGSRTELVAVTLADRMLALGGVR
jgi:two-component system, NarL family, response regulator DegU